MAADAVQSHEEAPLRVDQPPEVMQHPQQLTCCPGRIIATDRRSNESVERGSGRRVMSPFTRTFMSTHLSLLARQLPADESAP